MWTSDVTGSTEKEVDLLKKAYRKTPMDRNSIKKDESPPLEDGEITKFRSVVGRLMYMTSERPDAQFAIQSLARKMAAPAKEVWRRTWPLCSRHCRLWSAACEKREKGDQCSIHEKMLKWSQKIFICWR